MEIDYDTHLKPATGIKKTNGEDAAIAYLFDLLRSIQWDDYGVLSILKKMKGYYKKSISSNKQSIMNELNIFLNKPSNAFKSETYSIIAEIYKIEGNYEQEYQMLNGAISSVHPDNTSYLLMIAEYIERQLPILANQDLNNEKNAIDFIYWLLAKHLYQMAWWEECDMNMSSIGIQDNWKKDVHGTDYPFHYYESLKAFNTISKGKSIKDYAIKFQNILFGDFRLRYRTRIHQSTAVGLIDDIVNNYIKNLS